MGGHNTYLRLVGYENKYCVPEKKHLLEPAALKTHSIESVDYNRE